MKLHEQRWTTNVQSMTSTCWHSSSAGGGSCIPKVGRLSVAEAIISCEEHALILFPLIFNF